ncbi:MAG: hypothetical protein ACH350_06930 [Parachlamydiaceae bacterium]
MILKDIQKKLEHSDFISSFFVADSKNPFDRLFVSLGLDAKKREQLLAITTTEQQIDVEGAIAKSPFLPVRIQYRIELPFHIEDFSLNQVASLILFLNQFIDLPGFELDELHGKVFYRYVWITIPNAIDPNLIITILEAIILNLSLFSEVIESLAEGKTSFNDLLSQIIELSHRSHT